MFRFLPRTPADCHRSLPRHFLHTTTTLAVSAFVALFAQATQTRPVIADQISRPNIVLCMADDQGWGDVGYYKKSIAKTPNLDEMASSGLRFDRFYAAAPVCSPTRGSVLTGRHPNRYGCFQWGHSLRPEELTIAEVFRAAGYRTGHFGKWHLGSVDSRSDVCPGASGFDRWVSSPNFYENNPFMCSNGKVIQLQGESSVATMNAAVKFITSCQKDKRPFLAVVWFGSPHNPHVATDANRKLFPNQPKRIQHYYGEIAGIDRSMGILRKELRRLGLANNTVVWYTSDNGPQGPRNRRRPGSSGGLRDRKGTLWEGGIRVPTIIEWPARIKRPRITNHLGGTVDIFPTLVDIVQAKLPARHTHVLDGESLLPTINGQKNLTRRKALGFWNYRVRGTPMRSKQLLQRMKKAHRDGTPLPLLNTRQIRDDRANKALAVFGDRGYIGHAAWMDQRYKLHRRTMQRSGKVRYELYDLVSDPQESKNLADKMPQRVQSMKTALAGWQKSVVDSLRGKDYRR